MAQSYEPRLPPSRPRARSHEAPSREVRVQAEELARALESAVRGEVRFSDGDRALWATDASNYRQVPIGVVLPRDADDIVQIVEICRSFGAPIVPRGGGTSLAGQACNVAVVIDCSKYMHHVEEIDAPARRARVQPGCIMDDLRHAALAHGLTYAPDPATHDRNTIGGMLGNNSCGIHAIMSGRTSDTVEELEILTYDGLRMKVGPTSDEELADIIRAGGRRGEIYGRLRQLRDRFADRIRARYPQIPRRVSGYNLDELLPERGFNVARALVGTEGTCVMILDATVHLLHNPAHRALVVLGYPTVYEAADHVPQIMGFGPIGLEAIDDLLLEYMKEKHFHTRHLPLLPPGKGWLLVEYGGDSAEEADGRARDMIGALKQLPRPPSIRLFDDPLEVREIWEIREAGLGATAFVQGEPDFWPGWEDAAVSPAVLGGYLRDFRRLLDEHGLHCSLYGHFGQGCVHCRISFDVATRAGIANYRHFAEHAADLVVRYGGSLSGEHGDGQSRAELLPKMYGEDLVAAFRAFKHVWDPDGRMNPGKVVDPYRLDENLRLGAGFRSAEPETHFRFPEDRGSFGRAALRCVGVGKCRRESGGTMCPSYMVTRDERHTTRGRAHALWEMLQGGALHGGWHDEHVKESLDLCLSCKGCKHDCPISVDMATYKAEFLSHYYEGRLRPRTAYAMGRVMDWVPIASKVPRLVNAVSQSRVLGPLARRVAGIAPDRKLPRVAERTFKSWFFSRPESPRGAREVILFADTFNNYFRPETAMAAVEVLEDAGFTVRVPRQRLCCGRPLYDYGWLDAARRHLEQVLEALRSALAVGTPVVGLEPSCVSVFRDEAHGLLPDDPDIQRLRAQTVTLGELLRRDAPGYAPRLERRAVIQGHCHHKAVLDFGSDTDVMEAMGIDTTVPDSGCCGMAGAFGYEAEHFEVSMACGERVLLPEVRGAAERDLIVADGFSCRSQIEDATDRQALHLSEVLYLAKRFGAAGPPGVPERALDLRPRLLHDRRPQARLAAGVAIGLAAAGLFALLASPRVRRSALGLLRGRAPGRLR